MLLKTLTLSAFVAASAPLAQAELPDYQPAPNYLGHTHYSNPNHFPPAASLSGVTPHFMPDGGVAARLLLPDAERAVWIAPADGDPHVIEETRFQGVTSGYAINQRTIAWDQWESEDDGLFTLDRATNRVTKIKALADDVLIAGQPLISAGGTIVVKSYLGPQAYRLDAYTPVERDNQAAREAEPNAFERRTLAADVLANEQSPYAYLFSPSINTRGHVAIKLRLGGRPQAENQPDAIHVFDPQGKTQTIAEDFDANPASRFMTFDNSVAINDAGDVAFVAQDLVGIRGVWLFDGVLHRPIAQAGREEIHSIAYFGVALNDGGTVAFRGKTGADAQDALFVADVDSTRILVKVGDELPTEEGVARVKGFSGSPAIDDGGRIAVCVSLEDVGRALYVFEPAIADKPEE